MSKDDSLTAVNAYIYGLLGDHYGTVGEFLAATPDEVVAVQPLLGPEHVAHLQEQIQAILARTTIQSIGYEPSRGGRISYTLTPFPFVTPMLANIPSGILKQ